MGIVLASQLIYTNVEEDRSPRRREGYQTLFYSRSSISEAEASEIEARLAQGCGGLGERHIFFRTQAGRVAVGRVVPMDGTDRFDRTGLTFGHALVFEPQAFAALNNDPFLVIGQNPFYSTADQALYAGDGGSGDIQQASVSSEPPALPSQTDPVPVERDALRTLLVLASQAERIVGDSQAIALVGDTREAFGLLARLFAMMPPPVRLTCSFDTQSSGSSATRLPCWAAGIGRNETVRPNFIRFDLAAGRFAGTISIPPNTLWERWIASAASVDDAASLEHGRGVYEFSQWLSGAESDTAAIAGLQPAIFSDIFEQNRHPVQERMALLLGTLVGAHVGRRILPTAMRWLESRGAVCIQDLASKVTLHDVSPWVADAYLSEGPRTPPEAIELADIARRCGNRAVALTSLWWSRDWRGLAVLVNGLGDKDFDAVAKWVLDRLSARVTWPVRRGPDGLSLGPCISCPECSPFDLDGIMGALLGYALESGPSSAGAGRPSPRFGIGKKSEPQSFLVATLPSGRLDRWAAVSRLLCERAQKEAIRA